MAFPTHLSPAKLHKRLNALLLNPDYQPLLAIVKGARNGLVYGAKIRFPHALVMSILFMQNKPWHFRAKYVLDATKHHAFSLAKFATVYKTILLLMRQLVANTKPGGVASGRSGTEPFVGDTFLAGAIGGWAIFSDRNPINEQVVQYIIARIFTSFLPRAKPSPRPSATRSPQLNTITPPSTRVLAAKPGPTSDPTAPYPKPPGFPYPRYQPTDRTWFALSAAIAWGMAMDALKRRRAKFNPGFVESGQYIYLDSEIWTDLTTWLFHNKP